jgi:WD40 repeat protein
MGRWLRTLTGHTGWVTSVAFSPDGSLLASGSWDRTIKLWRVSDGALVQTYDQETGTAVLSIQFSPNGQLFGYGRDDATVVVARNPFARREGDVNGDGCVDDSDLLAVLFAFGNTGSSLPEDLNRDGTVDDADLLEVLFNFGAGC